MQNLFGGLQRIAGSVANGLPHSKTIWGVGVFDNQKKKSSEDFDTMSAV